MSQAFEMLPAERPAAAGPRRKTQIQLRRKSRSSARHRIRAVLHTRPTRQSHQVHGGVWQLRRTIEHHLSARPHCRDQDGAVEALHESPLVGGGRHRGGHSSVEPSFCGAAQVAEHRGGRVLPRERESVGGEPSAGDAPPRPRSAVSMAFHAALCLRVMKPSLDACIMMSGLGNAPGKGAPGRLHASRGVAPARAQGAIAAYAVHACFRACVCVRARACQAPILCLGPLRRGACMWCGPGLARSARGLRRSRGPSPDRCGEGLRSDSGLWAVADRPPSRPWSPLLAGAVAATPR